VVRILAEWKGEVRSRALSDPYLSGVKRSEDMSLSVRERAKGFPLSTIPTKNHTPSAEKDSAR
jgi:hypothetical protein